MSRRSSRLDILTAAGLADSERERALREGQREAANTSRWTSALSSLIPAATNAAGAVYDTMGEQAVNEANALAASKADVMDQTEANDIVAANFKEPEKPGILDNLMAPIRAKAKATAATALASQAAKNTATRTAKEAADAKAAADLATAQERSDVAAAAESRRVSEEERRVAEASRKRGEAGLMARARGGADVNALREWAMSDPDAAAFADDTVVASAVERAKQEAEMAAATLASKNADVAKKLAPKPGPSATALDRQAKKDKLLDLQIAAAEGKSAPPNNLALTPASVTSLQKLRTDRLGVKQSLARVRQLVNDPEIRAELGKFATLEDAVVRFTGSPNEKFRRVATPLQQFINAYKNQVTGAAASDTEMATQIMPALPTMSDAPADFFVKLDENERGINALFGAIDAKLKQNDITAGDEGGDATKTAPGFDDF